MRQRRHQTIIQTVRETIEQHKMLDGAVKVVVAFSGGPDSVCLLDVLYILYRRKIDIHVAYINHGLRPQKNIMKEVKLAQVYALKYGVPCKIIPVKVRKGKEGIEAAAREARYAALQKYMRESSAQRIVFGHNSNDVIETFLMNFVRGSGAAGLSSLPPVRLPFIRPLINVKKSDILKYVRGKKLTFSEDETNRSLKYRRNVFRHKIVPELLKINPELHQTITREIELIKQDNEVLEAYAAKACDGVAKTHRDHVTLDIKKLLRYNRAVGSRILRQVIKRYLGSLQGYESKHFQEILSLKSKESGKKIHLPKKTFARREYDKIIIGKEKTSAVRHISVKPDSDRMAIGKWIIRTRLVSRFDMKHRSSRCEVFDTRELQLPLFLRSCQYGDILETKIGKKKLKKIFYEFKIPLRKRKDLLLLCDKKGILMIIGFTRAYRALLTRDSKKILVVEYEHAH